MKINQKSKIKNQKNNFQLFNIKFQIFDNNQQSTINNQMSNSGQVVLLLVLVTVLGLTIGLSLISRTVTDIRISSQIEQSNRAFSAAEAGVETALKGVEAGGPTGAVNLPGASAKFKVTDLGGDTSVYYFPYTIKGKAQTLWLMEHKADGTLDLVSGYTYPRDSGLNICWMTNSNGVPAMVLTLLYEDSGDYKISKAAFDPNSRNSFSAAGNSGGYCDGTFSYKATVTASTDFNVISSTAKLIALRLQPVYTDTTIAVLPLADLPVQGKQIVSMGETQTGVIRKIEVSQSFYTLPEMFNFTYFDAAP